MELANKKKLFDQANIIENCFGVYLLYCENPKYFGRTYIGFTVNPNRRIKQHNKGKKYGGAWKTSNRGPWKMVLMVHGFPNDIAALRFEWAWQNPQDSRRLNHLPKKKNSEKVFDYLLRILSEMLRLGPWNRLPLTVRWLEPEYARAFQVDKKPPIHMPICYGPIQTKSIEKSKIPLNEPSTSTKISKTDHCYCCHKIIDDEKLSCISPYCDMISHFECLANVFLEVGEYVPIEGCCPKCKTHVLWGELINKSLGCFQHLKDNEGLGVDYLESSDDESKYNFI